MEGAENIFFDKRVFLEISHNELNEEFEAEFRNAFGRTYKEFLELMLKEYNNIRDLASFMGITEKTLQNHLKNYSLNKTLTIPQWKRFLISNLFMYALKATVLAVGTIPIFYYVGYLILYGYFFGETDHSLLDVLIKKIPLNRASCYFTGFIFSGIVVFWICIFRLRQMGSIFKIIGIIYFLFASTLSLMYILFSTNSSVIWKEILQFLVIWLFPLLTAIILIFSYYAANTLTKHFKKIIASALISAIPLFFLVIKNIELKWIFLATVLQVIIYSFLLALIIPKINISWLKKNKKHKPSVPPTIKNFALSEFISYILLMISLIVVIIIPLISFIIFSTGNYLGTSLAIFNLIKNENLKVKDELYKGKLVGDDDNYLYISTSSRKLLQMSRDASIKIEPPEESIRYTGNSTNWNIELYVYNKNDKLWYNGSIIAKSPITVKKISYTLENFDQLTLEYSKPSNEIYISNKLQNNKYNELDSIDIVWYSENNILHQEKVQLSIK